MSFSTDNVAIILTGEEWFSVLVKFNDLLTGTNTPNDQLFSRKGWKAFTSGKAKLQDQLLAASAASTTSGRRKKRPTGDGDAN